jgi:hypothetical protein
MTFKPLGGLAVDSFQVRIPLEEVQIISDKLLTEHDTVVRHTGELIKTVVSRELTEERNGIKLRFCITRIQDSGSGIPNDYLTLGVHAKLRGNDYLQGLTFDSLPQVYDVLISFNVAAFTFDSFTAGRVTDLDIKQDFIAPRDLVKDRCSNMAENYITRKDKKAGVQMHMHDGIYTGHSFNDRRCAAFQTCPYMKVYDKVIDSLRIESREFFAKHPGVIIPDKLWRQEFTLKGKKHMGMFEIESTVAGVLSADQLKLSAAHAGIMKAIFSRIKMTKIKKDIAPRDLVDMRFMWLLMNKTGMTSHEIVEHVTYDLDKSNKAKYKMRLEGLQACDSDTPKKDIARINLDRFLGYAPPEA